MIIFFTATPQDSVWPIRSVNGELMFFLLLLGALLLHAKPVLYVAQYSPKKIDLLASHHRPSNQFFRQSQVKDQHTFFSVSLSQTLSPIGQYFSAAGLCQRTQCMAPALLIPAKCAQMNQRVGVLQLRDTRP